MIFELVHLLVVELFGMDDGSGIKGEFFSKGVCECTDIGITLEPAV